MQRREKHISRVWRIQRGGEGTGPLQTFVNRKSRLGAKWKESQCPHDVMRTLAEFSRMPSLALPDDDHLKVLAGNHHRAVSRSIELCGQA